MSEIDTSEKGVLETFVRLFNAENFFEAHEALETVWANRGFGNNPLRGLIQLCAALAHFQRGNYAGARSVMDKASALLRAEEVPVEIRGLADEAHSIIHLHSTGRFPKIRVSACEAIIQASF